jgi:hypothetical protein
VLGTSVGLHVYGLELLYEPLKTPGSCITFGNMPPLCGVTVPFRSHCFAHLKPFEPEIRIEPENHAACTRTLLPHFLFRLLYRYNPLLLGLLLRLRLDSVPLAAFDGF